MTPAIRPATHDFDVVTDAPAPRRRPPEPAEQPPPLSPPPQHALERAAPLPRQEEKRVRAAE